MGLQMKPTNEALMQEAEESSDDDGYSSGGFLTQININQPHRGIVDA